MNTLLADRRALLGGGAAMAASFALAHRPALAQVDARVVVVGGTRSASRAGSCPACT
jgi:hypothetical protein